jgi:hypothetical protein
MKISYAICVCDEHIELRSLLSFLVKTVDDEDEINVLVDAGRVTPEVRGVLEAFKDRVVINERRFCGDFSAHRNHHATLCTGDYIFVLDADEIPQEDLIKNIKQVSCGALFVPRINIVTGYTRAWCEKMGFSVNHVGWINWPDYQGRFYRNDGTIRWSKGLHERLEGTDDVRSLEASPHIAIWHVKTVDRQEKQDDFYTTLKSRDA